MVLVADRGPNHACRVLLELRVDRRAVALMQLGQRPRRGALALTVQVGAQPVHVVAHVVVHNETALWVHRKGAGCKAQ